jgi:uroporphyrinogen-III decarboxylase
MNKIVDYKCSINDETLLSPEELKALKINFPSVHSNIPMMITMAHALKEKSNSLLYELPFCHTIEAENIGANINLGNTTIGPRTNDYIYQSCEEIHIDDFDYNKGRLKIVLDCIETLKLDNNYILLNISGPFAILNNMVDSKYILKAMRRQPELIKGILDKLQDNIISYITIAKAKGVSIISFADPIASVSILGPKLMEWYIDCFLLPFLKRVILISNKELKIVLCPKLIFALVNSEKAHLLDIKLDFPMSFQEALLSIDDNNILTTLSCLHNNKVKYPLIKSLVID